MKKISAVLIVKNEEKNIRKCLETLAWVDEIIIIDAYSSDKTIEIAEEFTNCIYQNKWEGYAKQRNYGAELASSEWILSIDADERISPELAKEILEKINKTEFVAFNIPMQNYVFNRWMKHSGLNKQYHIRLYNKKNCHWESLIHEDIVTKGEVGKLQNKMLHMAYINVSQLINKIDKYTELEAEKLMKSEKKPNILKLFVYPIIIFLYKYFIQFGFLDGIAGFGWAIGLLFYHYVVAIKYFVGKDVVHYENTNFY